MVKKAASLFLLLALAGPSSAQSVVLPAEVRGEPREWVMVVPDKFKNGNTVVNWQIGPGLADETARFEKLFGTKAQGKILKANKAGRYEVRAWVNGDAQLPLDRVAVLNILSNKALSDSAKVLQAEALLQGVSVCVVVVGDPGPLPPEPKPPEPKPPEPSVQPLRVLLVYETAELSKMAKSQRDILYSVAPGGVRAYLETKCVMGPDGKTREYRIWDKDLDTTAASAEWKAARAAAKGVPGIVVLSGQTNAVLHAGPLPANITETLTLLKKFGG